MKTNDSTYLSVLAGLCLAGTITTAPAVIVFQDSFESPALPAGGEGSFAGWFAGGPHRIYRPTADDFAQTDPLAAPAEGRQCAKILDDGYIVRKVAVIQSDTVYTATAAYGALMVGTYGDWSIQLWAGPGDTHTTFIGQTFREWGVVNHPALGEWADNSYSFDSAAKPELVGQNLFVLISNYPGLTPPGHVGPVFVDNVRLDALGPGQTVSYGEAVLSDNPIHYYPLNDPAGSPTVADLGMLASTGGTLLGGITLGHETAPLLLGTAAHLDGLSGTYIDLGLFHPGDELTVEAWVNLDTDARKASYHAIVARWDGSYELDIANDDKANLVVFNTEGTFGSIASDQAVPRGSWHHLAASFAGGLLTMFVDGQQVNEQPFAGGLRDASGSSTTIMIGATRDGLDPYGFNFKGFIAQVAIYDHALSPARIKAHFQSGLPATAPTLAAGLKLELAWATSPPGYDLEEAATLNGPWQAVVYDPSFLLRQPGTNRYYVPVKEASRFYRLFKP